MSSSSCHAWGSYIGAMLRDKDKQTCDDASLQERLAEVRRMQREVVDKIDKLHVKLNELIKQEQELRQKMGA